MKRWILLIVISIFLSSAFSLFLHTRFAAGMADIFMKMIRVNEVRDDAGAEHQAPDGRYGTDKGLQDPSGKPLPEEPADQYLDKQVRQGDVIREAEEQRRVEREKQQIQAQEQQQRLRDQMERMRERTRRD